MRPKTADRYHSTTIKSILMKTPPQPLNIMSSRKMCRRPPTPHWHLKQYDYTHKDISNVVMLLCVLYHIIKICISFTSCLNFFTCIFLHRVTLLYLHVSNFVVFPFRVMNATFNPWSRAWSIFPAHVFKCESIYIYNTIIYIYIKFKSA